MVNFRVGDRVEVVNINGSVLQKGDIGVISIMEGSVAKVRVNNRPTWGNWISVFDLKLLPTDDQRIESLEKRVEMVDGIIRDVRSDNYHEIEAMKKEIAELRKVMESYFKVPVEPSTEYIAIDGEPISISKQSLASIHKTPNQLRAEIIEKAKWFVESYLTSAKHGCGVVDIDVTPKTKECGPMKYKFVVNEEKRTVVALGELYWVGGFNDEHKGIAKCNPSDVFNKWIGMAIALGRALGLDVSEFEGAVQPTFAKGQIIEGATERNPGVIKERECYGVRGDDVYTMSNYLGWLHAPYTKIINDTNAIYGEVE